jgi:dTDP-4-dehydrorhamnose reductase
VFAGEGSRPWQETDPTAPLSVYGQSKLAGEQAIAAILQEHVILRTSWLFAAHGQNFVRTMLRMGRERDRLSVVVDQIGCPTSASDLARVIAEITRNLMSGGKNFGIYHYAGREAVSWHQFAQAIFGLAGDLVPRPPLIAPISTKEFGAPAPRPGFSVLDCRKIETAFGIERAFWQSELEQVLAEIRGQTR